MTEIQKVISFYGTANAGKTTTLNKLIILLKNDFNYQFLHGKYCETPTSTILESDLVETNKSDKRVSFKHKASGKIIGIATIGDNEAQIKQNCDFFLDHNINIALTANRSRGKTRTFLRNFVADNNIDIFWKIGIQSIKDANKEEFYSFMATTLFNAIEIELQKA